METNVRMITAAELPALREEAYATAKQHGWHDEQRSDEHYRMLILTEMAEAIQADRHGERADLLWFDEDEMSDRDFLINYEDYIKGTVEDELADVFIRTLDLAGLMNANFTVYAEDEIEAREWWALGEHQLALGKATPDDEVLLTEALHIMAAKLLNESYGIDYRLNTLLLDLASYAYAEGIDLRRHVHLKMRYNEWRAYKHGNLKY